MILVFLEYSFINLIRSAVTPDVPKATLLFWIRNQRVIDPANRWTNSDTNTKLKLLVKYPIHFWPSSPKSPIVTVQCIGQNGDGMVMWLAVIFLISHGMRLKGLQLVHFSKTIHRIGSADRFISGIQTCSIRILFLESVKSTTSFRTNGILKPMFTIKITIKYRIFCDAKIHKTDNSMAVSIWFQMQAL